MTEACHSSTNEPLAAHRLFQTRDIDQARNLVAGKFCAHELAPGKAHEAFDACHNHAAGQTLSLNYLRYGCDVEINPGELGSFYLLQIPLKGTATVANGGQQVVASKRVASLLNPDRETRMTWHEGCEKLLVQIDRDVLVKTAERLTGRTLNHPISFFPEVRLTAPGFAKCRSNLISAFRLAQDGQAFGPTGYRHQALLEEELILNLLSAQRSTISHMVESVATPLSNYQLRKARSFILDNLSEPITLKEIAAEAGCSLRSLQTGFKRHFECSPMQYLTTQRLNQAHYLLQTLPSDTLVSAIAFDAGFSHLGRFSIAYRERFGCSPKETLTRGALQ